MTERVTERPIKSRSSSHYIAFFGSQIQFLVGGGGGGVIVVKVYVTVTAPDEVATVPWLTDELTFTLNGAAKLVPVTPPVALAVPVGSEPDDGPPTTVKVVVDGDHVTPVGPAGVKTTGTMFGPGLLPNW